MEMTAVVAMSSCGVAPKAVSFQRFRAKPKYRQTNSSMPCELGLHPTQPPPYALLLADSGQSSGRSVFPARCSGAMPHKGRCRYFRYCYDFDVFVCKLPVYSAQLKR